MQDRDFVHPDYLSRFERLRIGSDAHQKEIEAFLTGAKSPEENALTHASIHRRTGRVCLLGSSLAGVGFLLAACGVGNHENTERIQPDSTPIPTPVTRIVPTAEAQPTIVKVQPTATEIQSTPVNTVDSAEVEYAQIGKKAPDFTLNNLEGQPVSLSDFAGKPTIIFYYGYGDGCPPCKSELEKMVEITNKYRDQGLTVLTITFNEREAAEIIGQISPVLIDDEKTLGKSYPLYGVPTSCFINSDGMLVGIRGGERVQEGLDTDVKAIIREESLPVQPSVDKSIIKIPLTPVVGRLENVIFQKISPLIAENSALSIAQRKEINNHLGEVYVAFEDPSVGESGVTILGHLRSAGQILANAYCQNPNQDTLKALSMLADKTFYYAEKYIKEGQLDPGQWRETVESFNPACQIVHTLQD